MADDNDSLDIYDEVREDVVFPTILAKYFNKSILEVMGNLQSSKRKDDNGFDSDEELELDSDTDIDNQHVEEEQHSTSLNHQILKNCELVNKDKGKDTNSSKIFLDPSTKTQEEPLVPRIHNKEPMFAQKANLKENGNFAPESSTTASTGRNKGTQLDDKITSGEQINIGILKSKQTSRNQYESNTEEDILHFNKNQSNICETHFPEREDNVQQPILNAKAYTNIVESTINEDNMETFYASLEAETTSPLHVQDTQPNNVSVRTRPSEETQKALQILQDFVSKKFSHLLHSGHPGLMKDTLKYLLKLPPNEGFSLKTKSVILQLSHSFAQWSLDYNNANLKLESATTDLSKVEKVKDDLEANVNDFREMDMVEKCLSNQLANLQEEKRDLEEKINAIKAEIADFRAQKDMVAKRKTELFHKGRVMKVKRDDLRNQVSRLKAEQEWAKITQVNIEAEWSKLGEQFIGSTNFEEWT